VEFSRGESWDLLKAWVLVTVAFLILFGASFNIVSFALFGVVVGGAVILHELGHKYVAERYGYEARFKSNDLMLGIGVLMAFTGFIFIAPGAVHISGLQNRQQNALIAWAGPAVNAGIALVSYIMIGVAGTTEYFRLLLIVNAILGAFNMLPVGGFDGRKIWLGDKRLYVGTAIVLGILVVAGFTVG
jgi:Zn-dependent protease